MIFGSTAARFWFPDFREPKDLDILSPLEPNPTKEVQYYWYGASSQYILDNNKHPEYVDPEFLYTLKAAHANFNVFWEKTMGDIVFFQRKGLQIHDELYKLAAADFKALYGKRHAEAMLKGKTSITFFQDAVPRKYIHDSIHEAVAYYDSPLYERILKGDGTVACSKEKFEALSFEDQLRLVKEEVFVTALERFLIPEEFRYSTQRAYWLSLKKLITTMSSGWFSRFIIGNYDALAVNKDNYVKTFNDNSHKLILC